MMGNKERHFSPLINVSLEELVPPDHFYRHLERTLDLSFVRAFVKEAYANKGRPSIDPVVFFKLQLVMFFEGIRSERQLMRHAADRLSISWYIGYDLGEPLPDHSSLTRIRERYGVDVFRRFFDAIAEQCQQEKLVWGKELYIDSTQVNANADLDSLIPRFAVEAREAIQTHLAALFSDQDTQPEPQIGASEAVAASPEATAPAAIACPVPLPLPVAEASPEREELTQESATRHDWIAEQGRPQREVRGYYQRTSDLRISTTDPDATPMRLKGGGTHLGYHVHYVVDGGKARIILQALVTPSEVMDNQPMRDLIFRTRFRWKLHPRFVTGDTKYGTIENIKALEDAGIRAYVPLPDWEERYAVWSASHFRYDPQADQYRCPQDQLLHRVGGVTPDGRQHNPRSCFHLQCLPSQRAVYDQYPGASRLSSCGRGVSRAGSYLSADLRVPESSAQTPSLGGAAVCRSQRLAWTQAFSLAAALARQHRGLAHRGWTKSQTVAQETRLGTPPVPNRGPVCLFFGLFTWGA